MISPFFIFLLLLLTIPTIILANLATYQRWTPKSVRYCEHLISSDASTPDIGGTACGATGYTIMKYVAPVEIDSVITLGLINVGWLTYEALRTERDFWKTCKSYAVRIFDGLFTDQNAACTYMTNPPAGVPTCFEPDENLLYRSGSGYCMKEKVCGASFLVSFLASADNSSVVYSWEGRRTTALKAAGYRDVGSCYAYKTIYNPRKLNTTILTTDEFF